MRLNEILPNDELASNEGLKGFLKRAASKVGRKLTSFAGVEALDPGVYIVPPLAQIGGEPIPFRVDANKKHPIVLLPRDVPYDPARMERYILSQIASGRYEKAPTTMQRSFSKGKNVISSPGILEGDVFFIEAGDTLIETVVVYESNGKFIIDLDETALDLIEAKYHGRTVPLGKPMKGDVKKSKVYVRKPNGNIVKVNFGDKKMRIKKSNPKRRKSFRARHNCANPGPRWKARYWSCRAW